MVGLHFCHNDVLDAEAGGRKIRSKGALYLSGGKRVRVGARNGGDAGDSASSNISVLCHVPCGL